MRTRYPSLLHFDGSGTAVARFPPRRRAEVVVHRVPRERWVKTVCPISLGSDHCRICSGSAQADRNIDLGVGVCWDALKGRWCCLGGSSLLWSRIESSMRDVGVGYKDMSAGMSVDVMLQKRPGESTLVEADRRSIDVHDWSEAPYVDEFLGGMSSRSMWRMR